MYFKKLLCFFLVSKGLHIKKLIILWWDNCFSKVEYKYKDIEIIHGFDRLWIMFK